MRGTFSRAQMGRRGRGGHAGGGRAGQGSIGETADDEPAGTGPHPEAVGAIGSDVKHELGHGAFVFPHGGLLFVWCSVL